MLDQATDAQLADRGCGSCVLVGQAVGGVPEEVAPGPQDLQEIGAFPVTAVCVGADAVVMVAPSVVYRTSSSNEQNAKGNSGQFLS